MEVLVFGHLNEEVVDSILYKIVKLKIFRVLLISIWSIASDLNRLEKV